ncbi:MAG: hypothetical protein FWD26_10690, partial [Treponema sp.]|nr:hypothetical protein [Treponema sp.]
IQTAEKRFANIIRDKEELLAYDRYLIAECDRISELNEGIRQRDRYVLDLIDQGLTTEQIKQRLTQKVSD